MKFFKVRENLDKLFDIFNLKEIKPGSFDGTYGFNDYSTMFFVRTPADVEMHYHIVVDDLEMFNIPNFLTDVGLIYDVNENLLHFKVLHVRVHTGTRSPDYPRLHIRTPFYMTEEEHFQESLVNDIFPYEFYIHVYKLFHALIKHHEVKNESSPESIKLPARIGRYEEFYSEPWKKS